MWFLATVKYTKENEKGLPQNIAEQYLVDAVSFTECESIIYEELEEKIRADFQITALAKQNITDVFDYEDSEDWFKCKMTYLDLDALSGKMKVITTFHLIMANDAKQAYERMFESMSNMQVTFQVPDVTKTKIVEVFPYEREEKLKTFDSIDFKFGTKWKLIQKDILTEL